MNNTNNVACTMEPNESKEGHTAADVSLGEQNDISLLILPMKLKYFMEIALVVSLACLLCLSILLKVDQAAG